MPLSVGIALHPVGCRLSGFVNRGGGGLCNGLIGNVRNCGRYNAGLSVDRARRHPLSRRCVGTDKRFDHGHGHHRQKNGANAKQKWATIARQHGRALGAAATFCRPGVCRPFWHGFKCGGLGRTTCSCDEIGAVVAVLVAGTLSVLAGANPLQNLLHVRGTGAGLQKLILIVGREKIDRIESRRRVDVGAPVCRGRRVTLGSGCARFEPAGQAGKEALLFFGDRFGRCGRRKGGSRIRIEGRCGGRSCQRGETFLREAGEGHRRIGGRMLLLIGRLRRAAIIQRIQTACDLQQGFV